MWITFGSVLLPITKYRLWKRMIPLCKFVKSSPQDCGEFVETVENNGRSLVSANAEAYSDIISTQRRKITEI